MASSKIEQLVDETGGPLRAFHALCPMLAAQLKQELLKHDGTSSYYSICESVEQMALVGESVHDDSARNVMTDFHDALLSVLRPVKRIATSTLKNRDNIANNITLAEECSDTECSDTEEQCSDTECSDTWKRTLVRKRAMSIERTDSFELTLPPAKRNKAIKAISRLSDAFESPARIRAANGVSTTCKVKTEAKTEAKTEEPAKRTNEQVRTNEQIHGGIFTPTDDATIKEYLDKADATALNIPFVKSYELPPHTPPAVEYECRA